MVLATITGAPTTKSVFAYMDDEVFSLNSAGILQAAKDIEAMGVKRSLTH
jgi:hypothetical protein